MKFLQNRTVAVILCVIMIVGAISIGGSRSLGKLRDEAESILINGTANNDQGVDNDLEARIGFAKNLIKVAERYLVSDDTLISACEDAITDLENAETFPEKYDANVQLTEVCDAVYMKLNTLELTEEDARYNANMKSELDSRNGIIGHVYEEYNKSAGEFNDLLKKFPTNLISKIAFVDSLDLYEIE